MEEDIKSFVFISKSDKRKIFRILDIVDKNGKKLVHYLVELGEEKKEGWVDLNTIQEIWLDFATGKSLKEILESRKKYKSKKKLKRR